MTLSHFSPIVAGVWKWGAWGHQLGKSEQAELIKGCLDCGVTTFDHADIYGGHTAEAEFGEALQTLMPNRQNIQLVTKYGIKMPSKRRSYPIKSYDTGREHMLTSVEQSLKALQTDYIDLLLIHRPSPLMDPQEIADSARELIKSGKILAFGVSNFTASQFDMLQAAIPLATNQVEASLIHRAPFLDGTFDQCLKYRVRPMVWSPLGSGQLFTSEHNAQILAIRTVVGELQDKYGASSPDQIYLAWLMCHPSRILPVLGTARIERVRSALDAVSLKLNREDWFKLWVAASGEEVP